MKLLPKNGIFEFTNPDTEDFVSAWNGVKYTFPAQSTIPLTPTLFPNSSPTDLQYIRKKFAFELASKRILKDPKVKEMEAKNRGQVGGVAGARLHWGLTYSPAMLQPLIDECLNPLPIKDLEAEIMEKQEIDLHEDTKVLQNKNEQPGASETDVLAKNGLANI